VHIARWEGIGDRLGDRINGSSKADEDVMWRYTLSRDAWDEPRPDDLPEGYYTSDEGKLRHRRGWSYQHAAEQAEAERRFALAARLHRKEGFAWMHSGWGDRAATETSDDWPRDKLHECLGTKWRWAARAFFRAAVASAMSRQFDSKDEVLDTYAPSDVRWLWQEGPSRGPESDLDRIVDCWREYAKRRDDEGACLRKACDRLESLQAHLASVGRRTEAMKVYRRRCELMIEVSDLEGHRLTHAKLWTWERISRSGTSARRMLLCAAVLYALLFPALFAAGQALGYEAAEHRDGGSLSVGDDVAYSLANALTLGVSDLSSAGTSGALIQVFQSALAFLLLGVALWVVLRQFEE
jgi:hypothetical protein